MAMAMAALRETTRRLVSRREYPAAARPLLLTHSRGITYRLFIGGLSQFATEDSLADAFSQYGQVLEATIVTDKMTNRPKGFGFVKFASEEEANKAREGMNGKASFKNQYTYFSLGLVWNSGLPHELHRKPQIQSLSWQVPVEFQPSRQGLIRSILCVFLLDLRNANLQQVLNGRVIYVDIAKAKMNRVADSSPGATGPPKPPDNS